tara:strand:+ start:261 stop:509 length:249 start_codon:yes stop_codon:yes gene_type:complete
MATLEIKMLLRVDRLLSSVKRAADKWPQPRRDAFSRDWKALQDAGAEMCDVQMIDGVFVAYPAEDFTAHCAKYGVYPDGASG